MSARSMRIEIVRQAPRTLLMAVLALVLAGCSSKSPTSPTPITDLGQPLAANLVAANAVVPSGPGAAWSTRMGLVSWGCFSGAALFDGAEPCSAGSGRLAAFGPASNPVITAPPTNLQHSVQGTTVLLRWTAPAGNQPTSYVIDAGTAPGSSNITSFDTGNAGTGLMVTNVPPGTYFVRVRGRDASGVGPASNEVTVVVSTAPPPPPGPCQVTNLTALVIGSDVVFTWNGPSRCEYDAYLIQVGSAPGLSDLAQVATPQGLLIEAYGASNVRPGTYYVRVRATRAGAPFAASNEIAVTVTGVTPPGTTRWTGLVANGEGLRFPNDPDCGDILADVIVTFVQTGGQLNAISQIVVRSAPTCLPLVGQTIPDILSGSATGSLASGSGTITLVSSDDSTLTATFSNGRMTGTVTGEDGTGTFTVNRQSP